MVDVARVGDDAGRSSERRQHRVVEAASLGSMVTDADGEMIDHAAIVAAKKMSAVVPLPDRLARAGRAFREIVGDGERAEPLHRAGSRCEAATATEPLHGTNRRERRRANSTARRDSVPMRDAARRSTWRKESGSRLGDVDGARDAALDRPRDRLTHVVDTCTVRRLAAAAKAARRGPSP